MATLILGIVIFGAAAFVVVSKFRKRGSCGDCHCDCAAKSEKND